MTTIEFTSAEYEQEGNLKMNIADEDDLEKLRLLGVDTDGLEVGDTVDMTVSYEIDWGYEE